MTRPLNTATTTLLKLWESGPLGGGKPALKAYKCTAGKWTLGWGHTKGVREGDTCTLAQAEAWFEQDTQWARECVSRLVKVNLSDNRYGAVVMLVFNIGEANFASSTLLKRLNASAFFDVPAQFRRWVYSGGVYTPGLLNRREAEIKLWNKP